MKSQVSESSWAAFGGLTAESSVAITGEVRAEARAPGGFELGVTELTMIGGSPSDYPIQPKEHGTDFLLDNRHFWLRTPRQVAIMRVRHEVEQAIQDFFYERQFTRCDTPILTAAIGERSGLFSTEYFEEGTAYLAQTGQLYGEALAAALGCIYTFGPTFRAEKSKTRRHLTEFWMIEPEMAWYDLNDSMNLQEEFVRFLVTRVLDRRRDELVVLERDTTKLECVMEPFERIDYSDAVALVQGKGSDIKWGEDLGAPDEAHIVDAYQRPVFVMNYPKEAKAFYMKENPEDPRTVKCSDLLAPEGRGEIIGGSQREDDHDKLLARIVEEGLPLGCLRLVSRPAQVWHVRALRIRSRIGTNGCVDLRRGTYPRVHPFSAPDWASQPLMLWSVCCLITSHSASCSASDSLEKTRSRCIASAFIAA